MKKNLVLGFVILATACGALSSLSACSKSSSSGSTTFYGAGR